MKLLVILMLSIMSLFATVDINSASIKELTTIKGIGVKKAEAIVAYRKSHCFKKVDDIVQVKGIGKKFLDNNKKNLKVGKCLK